VVCFVVEDADILHAHEVGHDPLDHLPFGFKGVQGFSPPLEEGPTARGEFDPLAELERVVICDHDLRAVQVIQHFPGTSWRVG
jgi:hypothetical protein